MRHSAFTVVYDACVLYPAPLRDFLIRLAMTGAFRARWTERIQDEWLRSVLAKRPELQEMLGRTRQLMDDAVPDCLVKEYEPIAKGLVLPDPDDVHVLAAAIRCGASVIVTMNLKDFPVRVLDQFGIEAQHPDEFIDYLFDLHPAAVVEAASRQRANLRNPPMDVERYLDNLLRQGLTQTVKNLTGYRSVL
jgi:predicted nucleic acid-binding protein